MSAPTKMPVRTKVTLDGKPGTVIARSEHDAVSFLLVARPSGTEVWVPEGSDRIQPREEP